MPGFTAPNRCRERKRASQWENTGGFHSTWRKLNLRGHVLQGKLVGRVFEWLLPQPVDDCLRVLSSCLLGGKNVTPLMCSTTETIGNSNADDGEDTVSLFLLPVSFHRRFGCKREPASCILLLCCFSVAEWEFLLAFLRYHKQHSSILPLAMSAC